MKEYICEIVPIYVRPQPVTNEKACAGIIVRCPENGFSAYRLIGAGDLALNRVANFFLRFDWENLLLAPVRHRHNIEFSRSRESREIVERHFANFIRPRENVIQYGAPKILVTPTPDEEANRFFRATVE